MSGTYMAKVACPENMLRTYNQSDVTFCGRAFRAGSGGRDLRTRGLHPHPPPPCRLPADPAGPEDPRPGATVLLLEPRGADHRPGRKPGRGGEQGRGRLTA